MTIFSIISGAESGNRNIPNTTQGTSSGQAQGYYQITTGTWQQFAPQAGVDLSLYPTALSAPQNVQQQVASVIPLNRWASPTVAAVQAAYPGVDTTRTLGQISAQYDQGGSLALHGQPNYYEGYGSNGTFLGATSDPQAYPIEGATNYNPVYSGGSQSGVTGEPPAYSTGPDSTTTTSNAMAGQPGYLPPAATGGPMAVGITTGLASGITGWISNIETSVGNAFKNAMSGVLGTLENIAARTFLIILAVIVIAIALWRVMDPDGTKTRRLAEVAAA